MGPPRMLTHCAGNGDAFCDNQGDWINGYRVIGGRMAISWVLGHVQAIVQQASARSLSLQTHRCAGWEGADVLVMSGDCRITALEVYMR